MSRHPKPPGRSGSPASKSAPAKSAPARTATAKGASAKTAPPAKPAAKRAVVPSGPPPAVGTDGLTKDYGDRPALLPLDLAVADGQSVALIGHNGSGKTTLLRMLAGLLEPSGGSASVHGNPVGSLAARAQVSFLSDNPTFYDDLSVWEHLEYVARLHGLDEWEQDAADLLGHLGLYERADDLPTRFSRGLRQKASIAIAFVRPYDVLLVDEPFVGLDAGGKQALLELFEEAHGAGRTLLVATHELSFLERVQRCVALRDGEVVHDGPTEGVDVLGLVS
jgi:ABC-type multidrug transport system ATPase subunit